MHFILSALLATTLLATIAVADVHHQGQQAAFHLEPRHNHHNKIDHSHHRKSFAKKQRRDMQQQTQDDTLLSAQIPINNNNNNKIANTGVHIRRAEKQGAVNLHRKKANHSHHRKSSHHHHSKVDHSHHRQSKRALALHRKKADHSHYKSGSCNHEKRAIALHRKKDHHKHKSGSCNHEKRAIELHRKKSHHNKVDHSHHHQSSSSCNKMQKRAAPANKKANKKANADEELAFHRKISRNRKTYTLGKKKNEKRDMFSQKQAMAAQDEEYTVVRAQEPVFKTQDIKMDHSARKQRKVSSPRKSKKAQRKQKKDN